MNSPFASQSLDSTDNELVESNVTDSAGETILKIALPVPLNGHFDYIKPSQLPVSDCVPGCRILVPFGQRKLCGIILGTATKSQLPTHKLRLVYDLIDTTPLISTELLSLAQWVSDYYFHPIGEVIFAMMPTALRQANTAHQNHQAYWSITQLGQVTSKKCSPAQSKALGILQEHPQGLSSEMLTSLGVKLQSLKALEKQDFLQKKNHELKPWSAAKQSILASQPPQLTTEQEVAIQDIAAHQGVHLLFGVTGSGKTEVYMALIHTILTAGQQVMLLVPEIGLTPQTLSRFQKRFNCPVAVMHSQQTDTERVNAWQKAHHLVAPLVIGTRSAVFASMPNLGLIIIDEEHDASYKQQDNLRYSARDVAILRAKTRGISIVLGSATPSLETLHNVNNNRFQVHELHQRATGASMPKLQLVDLTQQLAHKGLADSVIQAMQECLSRQEQVLVFLNRRGFAPAIICNDCGWECACNQCDARMTLHKRKNCMICHHCNSKKSIPQECPQCQSVHINPYGSGTEKIEDSLKGLFDVPIIRIDRDTTHTKKQLDNHFITIRQGKPLILIGTQMLSKGHDFHKVSLVVLLDIDGGLFSSEFRAEERTCQLLSQVSGRAGRGDIAGKVLVQTYQPKHPLLQLWIDSTYQDIAQYLLTQRHNAGLPPYSYHLVIRAEASQPDRCQLFLQQTHDLLQDCQQVHQDQSVLILGPVSVMMERRAGQHRYFLLLQAETRQDLHRLMHRCMPQIREMDSTKKVRWAVEVDPAELNS